METSETRYRHPITTDDSAAAAPTTEPVETGHNKIESVQENRVNIDQMIENANSEVNVSLIFGAIAAVLSIWQTPERTFYFYFAVLLGGLYIKLVTYIGVCNRRCRSFTRGLVIMALVINVITLGSSIAATAWLAAIVVTGIMKVSIFSTIILCAALASTAPVVGFTVLSLWNLADFVKYTK